MYHDMGMFSFLESLSAVHTRAHVYRALLEGLAYALREGKEQIERRTAVPIRRLRVAGGGITLRPATGNT